MPAKQYHAFELPDGSRIMLEAKTPDVALAIALFLTKLAGGVTGRVQHRRL